ncbi:MAG: alpha/beta hydrolase [bacterium]|nr:alpha/beta hydrolase [bacterium]
MLRSLFLVTMLVWFGVAGSRNMTVAAEPTLADVPYASVGDRSLKLDLYQPTPATTRACPTVIWVHGGAWRAGSKDNVPVLRWLEHGFAIASVEYRLSPEAKFPAQVHDIKAAIRYLRSHATELNLDPERFVIAGASAGGHLAALVGVSSGVPALEGSVGVDGSQPSDVSGIVSFYGASNLQSILSQSTAHGLSVRVPALQLLLGGQPDELPELAKLASPVAHVDDRDPPLWLIHGDADPQMPPQQSDELKNAYAKEARPVNLDIVAGGKHGGEEFYSADRLDRIAQEVLQSISGGHANVSPTSLRLLFAGSSSTYWNDMPNEVAKVISGEQGLVAGRNATAELVGRSGSDIRVYLDPNCDYQYGVKPGQSFLDKIRDEDFDYVVLMTVCRFIMGDGDDNPDGQAHRDAISVYCEAIRQAGAEPVFYEMGWGTGERESQGRNRIRELARLNKVRVYVPCSTAWARVREERPDLHLQHANDSTHPGDLGHFLNLACFYSAFSRQSPEGKLPREFHVWPHWTKQEKERLSGQIEKSYAEFQPDDYQSRLPEWMRRNAGAGYRGTISDADARYLERIAWETTQALWDTTD